MNPILHRMGPFLVYSYTVVLGIGILVAIGLTGWLAKKQHLEKWFDAVLVCLVFGIIGGRLGFVFANWDYFKGVTASIPRLWQGGYNYYGALFAAISGLWLWGLWEKRGKLQDPIKPFLLYADLLAPGFALLCAFGWLACWLEGCAFGLETPLGLFSADLPDEFGIFANRYQTQLIGIVWSLFVFVFAMWSRMHWHTGQLFWFTLGLISVGNLCLSFLRGDTVPMLQSIRIDVLINGTLVLISAFFVLKYQNSVRKS